jgi:predicted nucleotidyltransferase component of viral defense system
LKRDYDFEELERKMGFASRQIEKACRISDLLEDISNVVFLRDRLSLYGGTALAFIHLNEVLRLSIDLDFNYRHQDEGDWGAIRDQIDDRNKRLLYAQGYSNEDLSVQATYPLGRITVQYENHLRQNDSFKIEIGYMRRIPILQLDSLETFRHIATGEELPVKTPQPEELYANKWCTLLYRASSRDLFDVYRISKKDFKRDTFRKCAVIDSLMRGLPRLYRIDVEKLVESIPVDTALRNLLLKDISKYDFKVMGEDVKEFSQKMIRQLTTEEKSVINRFYEKKEFNPKPMDPEGILNSSITDHPMIRWALKRL